MWPWVVHQHGCAQNTAMLVHKLWLCWCTKHGCVGVQKQLHCRFQFNKSASFCTSKRSNLVPECGQLLCNKAAEFVPEGGRFWFNKSAGFCTSSSRMQCQKAAEFCTRRRPLYCTKIGRFLYKQAAELPENGRNCILSLIYITYKTPRTHERWDLVPDTVPQVVGERTENPRTHNLWDCVDPVRALRPSLHKGTVSPSVFPQQQGLDRYSM